MSKKHGATPDPDKQPLLFGDTPEQRGMVARLKAERGGDPFAAFVEWFIQANPKWAENAAHEITRGAVVTLRDLFAKEAQRDRISFDSFNMQFLFPVEEEPAFLPRAYRPPGLVEEENEPEQTTVEVAFSIQWMIAKKKEAESARRAGGAAPDITPEPGLPDWRWLLYLREQCTAYTGGGDGTPPVPSTLALWAIPDEEAAGRELHCIRVCPFRIETIKALAERDPEGDFPGFKSPEANEGKELLARVFPSWKFKLGERTTPFKTLAKIPIHGPEIEPGKPISFTIEIRLAPLHFDYSGTTINELHPKAYYPLFVRWEQGEGGAAWQDIPEDERAAIFQRILADIEAKITPEDWNFTPEDWNFPDSEKVKKTGGKSNKEKAKGKGQKNPHGPKYSDPAQTLLHWADESEFYSQSSAAIQHVTSTSKDLAKISPVTLKEYKEKFQADPKGIGFSLRDDRLDAFTGISRLFAEKNKPESGRFIIEREEYLVATGLEKILHADGKWQFPADQAQRRIDGLSNLALTPGIIGRLEPDNEKPGTFKFSQFIGTMLSIVRVWDNLTEQDAREIEKDATEIDLSKIKKFEVQLFTSLWEILPKNNLSGLPGTRFFFTPTNFERRLREAEMKACIKGKKSQARVLFIWWIFEKGAFQLHLAKDWPKINKPRLEVSYQELAEIMQLHNEISSGRRSRVLIEIDKAIRVAFHMGLISKPTGNSDKKRTRYTFDLKEGTIWKEIEEWKRRRDEDSNKKETEAEIPVEKETAIEKARRGMMEELDRLEAGFRLPANHPGHVFRSKVEKWIADRDKDLERRRNSGPLADVLREVVKRGLDILRGAELPTTNLSKPTQKATPASPSAPEEPPPAPDPAAAEIWKPFFDSLSKSMKEKAAAAVPARIEETAEGRRLVLWLPFPSLGFKTSGDDFKGPARAAGFALDWLESGER